ncbi:MAG: endonuclease/exonuclease/phosphatase family protein [Acidisphaera sp.]|nr:endonuclease/exonuclease/phosphatase family protein [Acidisphaera sp.]
MIARLLLAFALLLPGAAVARELKLATWNIEWFTLRPTGDPALPHDVTGRQPDDVARLRRYADALDADVVALEEVDGPTAAARLFPPDRYALHFTGDAVVQRTGLAIRRGLTFTANPDLTALDVYPPEAKFQLRSGADVTLDLPDRQKLRVLAVHLKTGCREDPLSGSRRRACETLREQVPPLAGWIAQRRAEGVPFVVMGDFNRWMDGSDQLLAALERAAPLVRATAGHDSPCWGGEPFIDHILAGGPARAWLEPQSLQVLVYRETDPSWKERLSDHCPVAVDLALP